MRDYDSETAFLRRMLTYDQSPQGQQIEKSIACATRDHACALRAVWTVGLLAILSAIVSRAEFFQSPPAIRLRILCVVGLAATICLLAFIIVLVFYRLRLDGLREDSRQVIQRLIEARVCVQEDASRSAET